MTYLLQSNRRKALGDVASHVATFAAPLHASKDRGFERRRFLRCCAFSLLAASFGVAAQSKVAHIGVVSLGAVPSGPDPYYEAFRQALRALGWVEGQNVVFDYRWAGGNFDRLRDMTHQVVEAEPDVVLAFTTPVAIALSRATSKIPIVFVQVSDPKASGLVTSLGRPGGNVTGLTNMSPELASKLLELLREAYPKLSHVAVLWNPTNAGKVLEMRELERTADTLAIKLQSLEVRSPVDFDRALRATTRARGVALIVLADVLVFEARQKIASFALANRLPTIFQLRQFVEAGGLMSYGINAVEMFRRAAVYVDKILRGTSPAELPVEQPTTFELVINSKTAKALGLTLPRSLLVRTDQVIE